MVTQESVNNSEESDNEADIITKQASSHVDATAFFDLPLRYVEQHAATTPGDIMLRCWCSIGSTSSIHNFTRKI